MKEMTKEEMIKFITNPANSGNCAECPYNQDMDDWQDRRPCGQWHCWVDINCEEEE